MVELATIRQICRSPAQGRMGHELDWSLDGRTDSLWHWNTLVELGATTRAVLASIVGRTEGRVGLFRNAIGGVKAAGADDRFGQARPVEALREAQ